MMKEIFSEASPIVMICNGVQCRNLYYTSWHKRCSW